MLRKKNSQVAKANLLEAILCDIWRREGVELQISEGSGAYIDLAPEIKVN